MKRFTKKLRDAAAGLSFLALAATPSLASTTSLPQTKLDAAIDKNETIGLRVSYETDRFLFHTTGSEPNKEKLPDQRGNYNGHVETFLLPRDFIIRANPLVGFFNDNLLLGGNLRLSEEDGNGTFSFKWARALNTDARPHNGSLSSGEISFTDNNPGSDFYGWGISFGATRNNLGEKDNRKLPYESAFANAQIGGLFGAGYWFRDDDETLIHRAAISSEFGTLLDLEAHARKKLGKWRATFDVSGAYTSRLLGLKGSEILARREVLDEALGEQEQLGSLQDRVSLGPVTRLQVSRDYERTRILVGQGYHFDNVGFSISPSANIKGGNKTINGSVSIYGRNKLEESSFRITGSADYRIKPEQGSPRFEGNLEASLIF